MQSRRKFRTQWNGSKGVAHCKLIFSSIRSIHTGHYTNGCPPKKRMEPVLLTTQYELMMPSNETSAAAIPESSSLINHKNYTFGS